MPHSQRSRPSNTWGNSSTQYEKLVFRVYRDESVHEVVEVVEVVEVGNIEDMSDAKTLMT